MWAVTLTLSVSPPVAESDTQMQSIRSHGLLYEFWAFVFNISFKTLIWGGAIFENYFYVQIHFIPLLTQDFGQKDRFEVLLGIPTNYHGNFCYLGAFERYQKEP